ncbi:MAG: PIN domain nuclease [Dehalococcoidia bacterium]|nr:PIN domain nuclease [Dehalococcoidia bacterium]MSQ16996.1 PIN domain nuclease [Dehalococcoidia bacterium]
MSGFWILRVAGATGFGALGWVLGGLLYGLLPSESRFPPWIWDMGMALAGWLFGFMATPILVVQPWRRGVGHLTSLSGATLLSAALGLLAGLILAALLSIPLYRLPGWLSWGVPVLVSAFLGISGLMLGLLRRRDVHAVFPALAEPGQASSGSRGGAILVDTSAIIDGRIADVTSSGFLDGTLIVPRFVLDELRHIADSGDALRRNRGRRGLEVLGRLRRDPKVTLEVLDVGVSPGNEVDSQLVQMARSMKCSILTTDYNLNRVAELQGVTVLNVNELANALKSIVLPGEEMRVNIVQEGKELGQGVAYLDDGTMVVVEGGRRYINAYHDVIVTRVLQTAAGRIIFSQPKAG